MASYNIYGHNSTNDDPPVRLTVVLNDDDTEIVSINTDDLETKAEAEAVFKTYMDNDFTAMEAVARYAGSYGNVKEASPDGSLVEDVEGVSRV